MLQAVVQLDFWVLGVGFWVLRRRGTAEGFPLRQCTLSGKVEREREQCTMSYNTYLRSASDDGPSEVSPPDLRVMRRTWGSTDAISIIFAGSAAEFAVNRSVDWLFWTNALPNAPIERFFETVRFAQAIAFGNSDEVQAAVNAVNRAHAGVERSRGSSIPAS